CEDGEPRVFWGKQVKVCEDGEPRVFWWKQVKVCEIDPRIGGGNNNQQVLDSLPKKYPKHYLLGQLIFWHKHNINDPSASLSQSRRGTIGLPDVGCCYAKNVGEVLSLKDKTPLYNETRRNLLISHLENKHWMPWPDSTKGWHWTFKSGGFWGSPFVDAAREGREVDPQVVGWMRAQERENLVEE
ncbi:hypothetical protein CYMTET_7510, partial [Cymbomonas tetramitiformis]